MSKRRLVFETKTKRFFEGPEPSSLVENLRDSSDHETLLNRRISEYLMQGLVYNGVPTHFIRRINMRETLIQQSDILPFSVFIRNRVDQDFAEAMDFEVGAMLPRPSVEFYFHNKHDQRQKLGRTEVLGYELATGEELEIIEAQSRRVNDFLAGIYWSIGYFLVDITLEFGRVDLDDYQTVLVIAEDIGPKQCQLWDLNSSDEQNLVHPELSDVAKRFGIQ